MKRRNEPVVAVPDKRPKDELITVDSSKVLDDVKEFTRKTVGSVEYLPSRLLAAGRELDYNCELQVRIDGSYFSGPSKLIDQRALWGTDVYTDDSDLLAVLKHLGYSFSKHNDVCVKILLLPPLKQYKGCLRNDISSRNWTTKHDGISYMVLCEPKKMPLGWASGTRSLQPERLLALKALREPYKSPLV